MARSRIIAALAALSGAALVAAALALAVPAQAAGSVTATFSKDSDWGTGYQGKYTITFNQLKSLYPTKTTAQLWRMVGVTPMLGQNDDGHIYNQTAARNLVSFAKTNHLGELAFWEVTRDRNACTGALYMCTNISQSPYEFSKIFSSYTG